MSKFEQEYELFLEEQKRTARGLRLEQLQKDLTGEKKLLSAVLWPVLKSFEGLIMEHEILSSSGVRMFIDVFYQPLGFAFESEGFGVHAEHITRDRFTFERMRVRTMMMYGYKYIPFSRDELDKKPEACRRSVYELLGRYSVGAGVLYQELSVNEREMLRYGLQLNRPLRLKDACYCLNLGVKSSRHVLRQLVVKQLIRPIGSGDQRFHEYVLEPKVAEYMF